jgi:hypothetical protein
MPLNSELVDLIEDCTEHRQTVDDGLVKAQSNHKQLTESLLKSLKRQALCQICFFGQDI